MLATYGACALIVVASLLVGRAFLKVLGRRDTWWLESAVGLAILIVVCSVLTRMHFGAENAGSLPERSELALIACVFLVVAATVYLHFSFVDGPSALMALPVVAGTLLLASLPFIASGHLGIPGIGVNNDMGAHLIWADWLQEPVGRAPSGILIGYPLGPHGMAATLADGLGSEPLYMFGGLLLAIPVITGLTALNLLRELPPVSRTLAACLVALPYMAASTLGIASFKELLAGLFLLAFALTLRSIPRATEGRLALIAALGMLAAAMVATYSYPGLAWLAAAGGAWALAELVLAAREGRLDEVRAGVRRVAPLLIVGAVVALAAAVAELPRIKDFMDSGAVGDISGTDSKLRYGVPFPEALGVWPSGSFLLGTLDVDAWQLYALVGVVALGFSLYWWLSRGDVALPAAVIGAGVVYLGTVFAGGRYVEAKALAVPASLVMLMILGALLLAREPDPAGDEGPGGPRRPREGIGLRGILAVPFIALAAYSTFLALRDTVVAPKDRFDELEAFRDETRGEQVLDLTSDRYFDYYLRSANVRSPAANAEDKFTSRMGKGQRLPTDFDTVFARDMDLFEYAVTTDADYQSGAPPNWVEADRTESYVLWRRQGKTPFVGVLAEEARPGRIFRCSNVEKYGRLLERTGVGIVWPRPVIAKRLYWEPTTSLEPGRSASQTISLPPGEWDLSFQYSSPVAPLRVEAAGLEVEMPPGVEGAIPYRPDQGPYWPVGSIESQGGPVEITVTADELSSLQQLLGVDAQAAIGNVVATRLSDRSSQDFQQSCGAYLDHYYLGRPGAIQISKESGGGTAPIDPRR